MEGEKSCSHERNRVIFFESPFYKITNAQSDIVTNAQSDQFYKITISLVYFDTDTFEIGIRRSYYKKTSLCILLKRYFLS